MTNCATFIKIESCHHCDEVSCPNCAAIWILISAIKQTSVKLFLCLGCDGIIECEVDNLGPLGNLQWGLRPGAVTSIRNCAFVRGAPGKDHVTIFKILIILPFCWTISNNKINIYILLNFRLLP